jgi:hypothetical protein
VREGGGGESGVSGRRGVQPVRTAETGARRVRATPSQHTHRVEAPAAPARGVPARSELARLAPERVALVVLQSAGGRGEATGRS